MGDFWSCCAQLRSQLNFLAIKYPLDVEIVNDEEGQDYLRVTATVIFPRVKGKAYISFQFDRNTYTRWPLSVRGLTSYVEVAYGAIEYVTSTSCSLHPCTDNSPCCRDGVILQAILNRLSQVSPADSHGCLLDACIEGTEQYE